MWPNFIFYTDTLFRLDLRSSWSEYSVQAIDFCLSSVHGESVKKEIQLPRPERRRKEKVEDNLPTGVQSTKTGGIWTEKPENSRDVDRLD